MRASLKCGRASFSTNARATLEPLLLFHRSHAGRTHAHGVRAAEKTELESGKAFEREACLGFHPGAQLPTGGTAAWQTSLILRDLPLKGRWTLRDFYVPCRRGDFHPDPVGITFSGAFLR